MNRPRIVVLSLFVVCLSTVDLEVSPDWELNFAVGRGVTSASQHWVMKSIVGYKFKH